MQKFSLIVLAGAVVAAAAAAVSVPAVAAADVKVVLPSQSATQRLGDGTAVTLSRSNERANINPSLGGTPLHRNAWVSAVYSVKTSKKVNSIKIQAGYIVGCQVNLNGATGSGNGSGSQVAGADPTGSVGAGQSVTVGPGQAVNYWVFDRETADAYGNGAHSSKINYPKTDRGRLSYTNQSILVNGCGGYAQARSVANVFVDTPSARQILTFYGRPFGLG